MSESLPSPSNPVTGIIPTIGNAVRDLKDQGVESAGEVSKVVRQEAGTLEQIAGTKADEVADAVKRAAVQVHSTVKNRMKEAARRTQGAEIQVADYVRSNPLKAILCAFGAGVLIGTISRR